MTIVAPGVWPPWANATTVVNNASYQAVPSDRLVTVNTIAGTILLGLPLAAQFPKGVPITFADASGSVSPTVRELILTQGSDTINKTLNQMQITYPFDQASFVSDGVSNWTAIRKPKVYYDCFGLHDKAIDLPANVWTFVPLFTDESSDGTQTVLHPINAATTTVGAGSNTLVLPQGVINIANGGLAALAAGGAVPTAGRIVITSPNTANHDVVIAYAGTSAGTGPGGNDQFTGCTGGIGTLATGQVVRLANDNIVIPTGLMGSLGGCVTFPAAASGIIGIRLFSSGFPVGEQATGNPNNATNTTLSVTPPAGPPAFTAGGQIQLQMFQNSAAFMAIPKDGIQAPSFGGGYWDV